MGNQEQVLVHFSSSEPFIESHMGLCPDQDNNPVLPAAGCSSLFVPWSRTGAGSRLTTFTTETSFYDQKLILSTLLLCGLANAAPTSTLDAVLERGVLRVGFDAGYQPFEMTNKQGQYIGFDVDLAKMVAKEMGVKVEFVNTAWDGIIPALLTDKFDVIMGGMTVTPQRNLRVNFADPYIVVGQTIVFRKDKAGEIKSFQDLNDPKYKIAVKPGTTGEQAVKRMIPKATLLQFETQDDAKLEVINGKVDAFAHDPPYNAIFASQNQGAVVHLDKLFTFEPLAGPSARGSGHPQLVQQLPAPDQGRRQLRPSLQEVV